MRLGLDLEDHVYILASLSVAVCQAFTGLIRRIIALNSHPQTFERWVLLLPCVTDEETESPLGGGWRVVVVAHAHMEPQL